MNTRGSFEVYIFLFRKWDVEIAIALGRRVALDPIRKFCPVISFEVWIRVALLGRIYIFSSKVGCRNCYHAGKKS